MPSDQYHLWDFMQMAIGDIRFWPKDVRRLFWTKDLELWELLILFVFCHVNHLLEGTFMEWVDMNGLCTDEATRSIIRVFVAASESGIWNDGVRSMFGYNVSRCQFMTLDGRKVNIRCLFEK